MAELTPTRSAVLELQEERQGMQEGYRFLDEKRLVLAAEIMGQLKLYEALGGDFGQAQEAAAAALRGAVARHGLDGLQVYPPRSVRQWRVDTARQSVLGLGLQEAELQAAAGPAPAPAHASPEAEHCRRAFEALLALAARLAAVSGNLQRLQVEYQRTARRARALEDVLLPELDAGIAALEVQLEDLEREEYVRVRSAALARRERD